MITKHLNSSIAGVIDVAVNYLLKGELVAIPTETVYGLAADASNIDAINKVFQVKSRPINHPLIVHISDVNDLQFWAKNISDDILNLAANFWPGPMTILLEKKDSVLNQITAESPYVCIRIPNHSIALSIINKLGRGIVAPSANNYGFVSPTSAAHVMSDMSGKIPLVLDGGQCSFGIESTIIDCTSSNIKLLRPGSLAVYEIEKILGKSINIPTQTKKRFSGNLVNHYQPNTPLLLKSSKEVDELILDKKQNNYGFMLLQRRNFNSQNIIYMPQKSSEYAHNLYSTLRYFDSLKFREIILELPPDSNDWLAIHDRIYKSSHK